MRVDEPKMQLKAEGAITQPGVSVYAGSGLGDLSGLCGVVGVEVGGESVDLDRQSLQRNYFFMNFLLLIECVKFVVKSNASLY